MTQRHWTEANKHKAKNAFENTPRQVTQPNGRQPYRPPQPQLTPKGPLRNEVDQRVREKQAAIKAKFARDKQLERER